MEAELGLFWARSANVASDRVCGQIQRRLNGRAVWGDVVNALGKSGAFHLPPAVSSCPPRGTASASLAPDLLEIGSSFFSELRLRAPGGRILVALA